jgi:ribosome maturation factor RimP
MVEQDGQMDDDEADDGGADFRSAPQSKRVSKLIDGVTAIARPIAESFGCELDRVAFRQAPRRGVLQVFIDKPGGVGVEDCVRVSRQLSAELDVHDVIAAAYDLEVSSPGLDRPLQGEADFRKFAGRPASVTCRRALPGHGSKIVGVLRGLDGDDVLVETKDGAVQRIPLEMVAKARLEPEI